MPVTVKKKPVAKLKAPAVPKATVVKKLEPSPAFDLAKDIVDAFATNNRVNAFLIQNLADASWQAKMPDGKGRTIASIVSHMHNVRIEWLKSSAARGARLPNALDRTTVTRSQAVSALAESHDAIVKMIKPALSTDGRIKNFNAGIAGFMAYLMTHDAHHRGQICMQAKYVGCPLPQEIAYGMWEWSKR